MRGRWAVVIASVTGLASLTAIPPAQAVVPGPNGRIAFTRFHPAVGDDAIFTAEPNGTDELEVFAGPAEVPRWSPDGSRIAFVCFQRNFTFVRNCTMNPDGSGLVHLVPNSTLNEGVDAWSPDGTRLAFEGWDDVHPDRKPGVFTMRASDGGDLTRVTANPFGGHDVAADYAPDGSRLVFVRDDPLRDGDPNALFVVNVDGTGLRQLTHWDLSASDPSWSPDGKEIVFAANRSILRIDQNGAGLVTIHQHGTGGFSYAPVWSPDGTRILFADFVSTGPHQGQEDLYTMNPDGSDIAQVTDTLRFEDAPDWGADTR